MIDYAKQAGIALAVLFLLGVGFYFGTLKGDAAAASAKTAAEASQAAQASTVATAVLAERAAWQAQALTNNTAEKAHDQTIETLPARIVRTPVFLRGTGEICPDPVPGAVAKAGGYDPDGRGVQPRPRIDSRPQFEALKVKYETALADCRRLDAEWPK